MSTKFSRRLAAIGFSGLALAVVPLAAAAEESKNPFSKINLEEGAEAPGVKQLLELGNYIGMYALIGSLLGALLSLAILAIGPRIGFDGASRVGKVGIIVCVGIAFFVGALPMLLNFAYNLGTEA